MITVRAPLRRVAAWLEASSHLPWSMPLSLPLDPVRTLDLPRDRAVIAVGGATLGGSGRTPFAIALARALSGSARRVALVGHAYGARPGRAREVGPGDDVCVVGDEAILAAAALAGAATVHVAPTRAEALAHAAAHAEVLIVDRLLQTRPSRVSRSFLTVDAWTPWGSGSVVPFGDLVSPRNRLSAESDEIVAIGGPDATERVTVAAPRGRLGLLTACARPLRVVRTLGALGITPVLHVELADHAAPDPAHLDALARRHGLAAWIVDAKTSVRLPRGALGRPFVPLDHALDLAPDVVSRAQEAVARTLESGPARC